VLSSIHSSSQQQTTRAPQANPINQIEMTTLSQQTTTTTTRRPRLVRPRNLQLLPLARRLSSHLRQ
jgi:hypothetical protein